MLKLIKSTLFLLMFFLLSGCYSHNINISKSEIKDKFTHHEYLLMNDDSLQITKNCSIEFDYKGTKLLEALDKKDFIELQYLVSYDNEKFQLNIKKYSDTTYNIVKTEQFAQLNDTNKPKFIPYMNNQNLSFIPVINGEKIIVNQKVRQAVFDDKLVYVKGYRSFNDKESIIVEFNSIKLGTINFGIFQDLKECSK